MPAPLHASVTVRTVTDLRGGRYRAWVWSPSTLQWYGGEAIAIRPYAIDRPFVLAAIAGAPGWSYADLRLAAELD